MTTLLAILLCLLAAPAAAAPLSAGWLLGKLKCIHRYEGSWTDGGAPYWGGLQMDMTFQRQYGPEYLEAFGTADRWPAAVQLAVALKAVVSGRGFGPWPVTRRRCGV